MNQAIKLQSISAWFAAMGGSLAGSGVAMTDTAWNTEHLPSARADFDSNSAIGRISFWTTGEVDFQVLDRATERFAFFRHETVGDLAAQQLNDAFAAFAAAMAGDRERRDR